MESKHSPQELIILLFFSLIIVLLTVLVKEDLHKPRIGKSTLVAIYGVDLKTFKKWVYHFLSDYFPEYQARRKFSLLEVGMMAYIFGLPDKAKGDLVRVGEGSYRSLRESLRTNPDQWPLSNDFYHGNGSTKVPKSYPGQQD